MGENNQTTSKPLISKPILRQYLMDFLNTEYNAGITERKMKNILEGLEYAINDLVKGGYSFFLLGMKWETNYIPTCVHKALSTQKFTLSEPHYKLNVKVPAQYTRKLKRETRMDLCNPVRRIGVTELDAKAYLDTLDGEWELEPKKS
jgi:hypothetical protein